MRYYICTIALILGLNGYCCDCRPIPEMAVAFESASFVAHVRVIQSTLRKPLMQDQVYLDSLSIKEQKLRIGSVHVNEYKIVVLEGFKGSLTGDTLILRTALDPVTDCGLILSGGYEMVLYAYQVSFGDAFYDDSKKHAIITTTACSRTQSVNPKEVRRLKKIINRGR